MRVLLVDDQPDYRRAMAVTLRYIGCLVTEYGSEANSPADAAGSSPPDLIIADVDLGMGSDGHRFADAAQRAWPEVPTLFVSGLQNGAPLTAARSAMLRKPFKLAELTTAMGALLAAPSSAPPL